MPHENANIANYGSYEETQQNLKKRNRDKDTSDSELRLSLNIERKYFSPVRILVILSQKEQFSILFYL